MAYVGGQLGQHMVKQIKHKGEGRETGRQANTHTKKHALTNIG